jgi:hypothetical protein
MNAKDFFAAPLVEVVEEQAAGAAGLAAVLEIEVPVAPVLVVRVHVRPERVTRRFRGAMPVQDVLVERVTGREVESAAEPPCDRLPSLMAAK